MGPKLSVFFRSHLIQSWFNQRGLQDLGFLFALSGAVKDPAVRSRHLDCFNTNPCASTAALGVVWKMEEDGAPPEKTAAFKRMLSTALGSIGDSFFWRTLRPAVSATSLALWAALSWAGVPGALWIAAAASILLWTAPQTWLRWRGLVEGYERGPDFASFLEELDRERWEKSIRRAGLVALIIFTALALVILPWAKLDVGTSVRNVLILGLSYGLLRGGLSGGSVYAIGCALGTLVAFGGGA